MLRVRPQLHHYQDKQTTSTLQLTGVHVHLLCCHGNICNSAMCIRILGFKQISYCNKRSEAASKQSPPPPPQCKISYNIGGEPGSKLRDTLHSVHAYRVGCMMIQCLMMTCNLHILLNINARRRYPVLLEVLTH